MKTQIFPSWMWVSVVAALPLAGGCAQDPSSPTNDVGAVVKPVLAVASPDNLNTAAEAKSSDAETKVAAEKPASSNQPFAEKPAPPDIKLSPPLAEIAKLAHAGMEDSVMLAYITNSAYTFNLGSDQIIYLSDLGVSSEVITAMIQHDQDLSRAGGAPAPAATAPLPESTESTSAAQTAYFTPEETTNAPQYAPAYAEAATQPQPANVTYNYFYDSLAPYGNWINVDDYGMCWQPTTVVINHNWRPYCDRGRWIYTDSGWYWYSDYSWGWAPFHYGRWFRHHRWGWCWYPGYTWGPAWVTWRYTDNHCGWAPLPPAAHYSMGLGFTYYGSSVGLSFGFGLGYDHFSFVPWGRFWDHRPYRHCVPSHQVRQVYQNSTVINNVIVGNNNTIINGGIPPERVRTFTKTEVRRTTLRDGPAPDRGGRGERLAGNGQTLMVHRPQIPAVAATQANAPRREPARGELRRPTGGTPERRTDTRPARIAGDARERTQSAQPGVTGSPRHEEQRGASALVGRPARPAAPGSQPSPTVGVTREPARSPRPEAQPGTGSRGPASGRQVPPSITRGLDRPTSPTPAPTPTAPPAVRSAPAPQTPSGRTRNRSDSSSSSLVIIGKRDNETSRNQTHYFTPPPPASPNVLNRSGNSSAPSPANNTPAPQRALPNSTRTWTTPSPPPTQRQEAPRVTRSIEVRPPGNTATRNFSTPPPRSSAPAAPSFSPPAMSRPAPVPSYTPRPAPSAPPPAMSAPRAPSFESRSAPAPAPRASSPPPSAPSRSGSGRPGRDR